MQDSNSGVMEMEARRLYVWGSGGAGQLGLGDTEDYALPQCFPNGDNQLLLESVTSGGCHSAGVDALGKLFIWGDNEKNQLGIDAKQSSEVTKPKSEHLTRCGVKNTSLAACGWSHTVAVCSEAQAAESEESPPASDRVFSWGANDHFQLGRPIDSQEQAITPTLIPHFYSGIALCVKSVACGWKHSLLATETGEVFAWGSGRNGELGLGDSVLLAEHPTKVDTFDMDTGTGRPVQIQKVLCGWQHSVFHASSGEIFTCGSNRHGQLGIPAFLKSKINGVPRVVKEGVSGVANLSVAQVDAGWHFVLCLTVNGELMSWGKGSHGQLGHGDFESLPAATVVPFRDPPGIRSIACGSEHSLVVTNDGELFSCGWGEHGNLGHGDRKNRCTLEKVVLFAENWLQVLSVAAGGAVSIALVSPT